MLAKRLLKYVAVCFCVVLCPLSVEAVVSAQYRLAVEVNAAGYERIDKPVELDLNFTELLGRLDPNSVFDKNSIRVVEVDSSDVIIDRSVVFQFDQAVDYHKRNNATGTLVFILNGVTDANSTRKYHIYFGQAASDSTAASFPPQVLVEDEVDYEGQKSFKITTPSCTYYYHKKGSGFASMIDSAGNDWISYHPEGGSAGNYRGIPNIRPAGFHPGPGENNIGSLIISTGPIKLTFVSVGNYGQWKCIWEIFPACARMTLLEKGPQPYWILYEGTPGGKLDLDTDYWVQSSGRRHAVSKDWIGEITGSEWVYFGDANIKRTLYYILHEEDDKLDQFWQMEGNMTVFGFGRQYKCCDTYITTLPAHLTIGFAENDSFQQVSTVINSAYKPLQISVTPPQKSNTK